MKVSLQRIGLILLTFLIASCADEGSPVETLEAYLKARVNSQESEVRKLSCSQWEAEAIKQADSFRSMDAKLEGMKCHEDGKSGEYTLVSCEGKIVTTYNGETKEWPLLTYQMLQEDGEWKMCGEANPE